MLGPEFRSAARAESRGPLDDKVLATVNGETITARQLAEVAGNRLEPLKRQIRQITDSALTRLIDNLILEQAARSEGLAIEEYLRRHLQVTVVADEEVEDAYQRSKDQFSGFLPAEAKYRIRRGMEEKRRLDAMVRLLESLRRKAQIRNFLQEEWAAELNLRTHEGPFRGNAQAPVAVVAFCDFECPFCRQDQPVLKRISQRWPKEVRVTYKHLPLERHPNAFQAALASVCAHKQGRFWHFHDRLFTEGQDMRQAALLAIASSVGLELEAFRKCLASVEVGQEVEQDMQTAREAGVDGTPAYFVNNRRVRDAAELEETIAEMLSQKQ